MPRKALVATACVGHMSGRPTITANHELAAELLDRMGGLGADLACLPEEFTILGLSGDADKEEREKSMGAHSRSDLRRLCGKGPSAWHVCRCRHV